MSDCHNASSRFAAMAASTNNIEPSACFSNVKSMGSTEILIRNFDLSQLTKRTLAADRIAQRPP